jgi:hypothetical protein
VELINYTRVPVRHAYADALEERSIPRRVGARGYPRSSVQGAREMKIVSLGAGLRSWCREEGLDAECKMPCGYASHWRPEYLEEPWRARRVIPWKPKR